MLDPQESTNKSTIQRKLALGLLPASIRAVLSSTLFPDLMHQVWFREEKSYYKHIEKQFAACIPYDQQFCSLDMYPGEMCTCVPQTACI